MASRRLSSQLVLNIIMFVVTVGINSLAGASTLINGKTTGQVSDSYPTLITPQGFTFAIWSVIYILLGAFVVYQALPGHRGKPFHVRISFLFILSCLLNASWIFLWQYGLFAYSVILIFGLLASLAAIYLRLNIGKSVVPLGERICVQLPFSVYIGWITVASIANVAVAVTVAGWSDFGISPSSWAALVIVIALIITLIIIATRKDVAYSLVIIWALFGIMAKQSGTETVFWATTVSIIVILIALAVTIIASKMKKQR
jgi:benzodiazapine receptor